MINYIIRRLLLMVPTLIGVTAVVFFVMALSPGGVGGSQIDMNLEVDPEARNAILEYYNRRYGLDDPLIVQYGRWLNRVSPLGFQTTGKIEYSDETVQRIDALIAERDALARQQLVPQAEAVILGLARYQVQDPLTAAEEILPRLAEPTEASLALFDRIKTEPRDRFVEQFKAALQDQDFDEARRELIDALNFELAGRDRILFWWPTIKYPDLGRAWSKGRSVVELFAEALPITITLNLISAPLVYLIAIISGIVAAQQRGAAFDTISGLFFLALWALPPIWVGVMGIGLLANEDYARVFPASGISATQADQMTFLPTDGAGWAVLGFVGYLLAWVLLVAAVVALVLTVGLMVMRAIAALRDPASPDQRGQTPLMVNLVFFGVLAAACWWLLQAEMLTQQMPGPERGWLVDRAWHLFLPVLCMSYGGFALLSKLTRGAVLENFNSDYIRTARAKGVSEGDVLFGHAFRNSLLPLITVAAGLLPGLLVGSVIIENIFSIPGMGQLTIEGIRARDRELVLAGTLVGGVLTLGCIIIADVAYAIVDPRVSYE